jgi:hypothetical protein
MEAWRLFKIESSTCLRQMRTLISSPRSLRRILQVRTYVALLVRKRRELSLQIWSTWQDWSSSTIIYNLYSTPSSRQKGLHQHQASRHDTKIEDSIKLHERRNDSKPARATREASTFQDLSYKMMTFWLLWNLYGHTRYPNRTNFRGVSMGFRQGTLGSINSLAINFSKRRQSTSLAKASLQHSSGYHRWVGKAIAEA